MWRRWGCCLSNILTIVLQTQHTLTFDCQFYGVEFSFSGFSPSLNLSLPRRCTCFNIAVWFLLLVLSALSRVSSTHRPPHQNAYPDVETYISENTASRKGRLSGERKLINRTWSSFAPRLYFIIIQFSRDEASLFDSISYNFCGHWRNY